MSHPLPSQDAWTRARNRFVEDLDEAEKKRWFNASLEDIVQDGANAEHQHRQESRLLKISDRIQPLIAAIEQYGQALNVYANAYPLVLSPLWGSIRVVLHVSFS